MYSLVSDFLLNKFLISMHDVACVNDLFIFITKSHSAM